MMLDDIKQKLMSRNTKPEVKSSDPSPTLMSKNDKQNPESSEQPQIVNALSMEQSEPVMSFDNLIQRD